jgi:hypothetical protein
VLVPGACAGPDVDRCAHLRRDLVGRVYVAFVVDVYSRRIVGWSCCAAPPRARPSSCATTCAPPDPMRPAHAILRSIARYGTAGSPASTPSPDRTCDDLTTSRPHRSPAPPRASACPGHGPARPVHLGTDRVRGPRRRRWRWRWRRLRRPAGISCSQRTLTRSGADVQPAVRLDALNRRGRRCMPTAALTCVTVPARRLRASTATRSQPGGRGVLSGVGAGAADVLAPRGRTTGPRERPEVPVVVLPQEDPVELTSLIDRALHAPGT